MLARDEEPHAGGGLANSWIENRPGVDAPLKEHLGDENRPRRTAHDDRNHGGVATLAGVEIAVGGEFQKQLRTFTQPGHPPRLALDHPQTLERRGGVRRRAGGRKYERWRRVAEIADQPLTAGQVAAAGPECLADRSHPEVAIGRIAAEKFADTAAFGAHRAERMRLVHIEQCVVSLLHLDELRQVGIVAVHAVDALDRDHHPLVLRPQIAKQAVELLVVVVTERTLAGLRGAGPLHDAVVGQFVVEDQVAGAEEMVEHRGVRAVAAGKHHGPLRAKEPGQFTIEFVEDRVVAADHAAGRGAAAKAVDRVFSGPRHIGMAGKTEVVEAREADDLAAADAGRATVHLFVGPQEGIFKARRLEASEPLLERHALGKCKAVGCR